LGERSRIPTSAGASHQGYAAEIHGFYYNDGQVAAQHLVQSLLGSAIKDSQDDVKKLGRYFDRVVKDKPGEHWQQYYAARKYL
jgi:hypothetical protein